LDRQEENYKWLDFGNGILAPTAVSLKVMTQRDLHVLRVFTPDESDLPIGVVGLSNVDRRFKTAGSLWAVLGRKRYGGFARRAASRILTYGFRELGLEVIGAWTVDINVPSRRALEHLNFRFIGRQRRCHWIDASRTTGCCSTCWRRSTSPMTKGQDLETRIARLFLERLEVEIPSPDVDLFEAGVVDSLLFVKLLAALEEQFGFRLAFDELEIDDFRTLRHIARFVAAKRRLLLPG